MKLTKDVIKEISNIKQEPEWMCEFRLKSFDYFEKAAFVNSDSQLYKQAGNGVTVNVIEAIGRALNG